MPKSKAEITQTSPAHHGAFDYAELARLGASPDDILDFSVNSNPYGPPDGVYEAIRAVPLERYPDRECLALRAALGARHGVDVDQIVVGNGTAELLLLLAFAFLERSSTVIVPTPTFSEYARVAALAGADVRTMAWQGEDAAEDAAQRLASLDAAIGDADAVFVCNPNNPDGVYLGTEALADCARRHPHTLFVVDEAYSEFLEAPQSIIPYAVPNVLSVRSLTKDYALAGLRLGYAVGHPNLIEAIARVRPAWNVNGPAQAAGLAVLQERGWLRTTITQLHIDKLALTEGLRKLGLSPDVSSTHYFLVDVGNGTRFRERLLPHGLMVRDCASFGLPEHVRIATRTPAQNRRLLDAVAQVLHAG